MRRSVGVRGSARLLLGVGGPFVAILLLFAMGELAQEIDEYRDLRRQPMRPVEDLLGRVSAQVPRPGADSVLADAGLPVYDLRIGPKQLERLHEVIDMVQARGNTEGLVMPGYERAYFLLEGDWVPVRVKLRGWAANHYSKAHPSLRLKFPSRRLLHGLRQVNLVDPYDKFITADVATSREAARHGVLTWQSGYVIVRLNGETLGLYLQIEQPGRELLEAQNRPEGPIFSPNGNLYGSRASGFDHGRALLEQISACADAVSPAPHCTWEFVQQTFDTDRLAWAAAVMGLSGHWGAWLDDNLRFAFDPGWGTFEPIPWDYGYFPVSEAPVDRSVFSGAVPDGTWIADGEDVARLGVTLLGLPQFREMRDERLWELATTRVDAIVDDAEELFQSIKPALAVDRRAFGSGAARELHQKFIDTLRANAALFQRLFEASAMTVGVRPPAEPGGPFVLRFENRGKAATEVTGLRLGLDGGPQAYTLPTPIQVPGRWRGDPGSVVIPIQLPAHAVVEGIDGRNRITDAPLAQQDVTVEPATDLAVPPAPPRPAPFDAGISGVAVEGNVVRFGPGSVSIRRTLEIPEGYDVQFVPGLDLKLAAGQSLLLHGDLTSLGTSARPVRVGPADADSAWGSLAVLGRREAPRTVVLDHTIIEGGSQTETDRVIITGAFAVHGGNVTIRRSEFRNAHGEDSVNLKHSAIELDQVVVRGAASDAIDLDFCDGRIADSVIEDIDGDGVDLSGSHLLLEGMRISRTGDKGISVGERTTLTVRGARLAEGFTGIAVKDASTAEVFDSEITDQKVGLAAYVKKPSFGGSSTKLQEVRFARVQSRFLVDPDCRLTVDGEPL